MLGASPLAMTSAIFVTFPGYWESKIVLRALAAREGGRFLEPRLELLSSIIGEGIGEGEGGGHDGWMDGWMDW